jgi:hypothetical protein
VRTSEISRQPGLGWAISHAARTIVAAEIISGVAHFGDGSGAGRIRQRLTRRIAASGGTSHPYEYCGLVAQCAARGQHANNHHPAQLTTTLMLMPGIIL